MVQILPWIPAKQAIDFREVAWNSEEHLAECFVAKFQWLNKSACSFDMFINETHRSNFQRSVKQLSWIKWPAHLEKTHSCPCKSFDCMLFASVCMEIHLFKVYRQFVRLMSSFCSFWGFFCIKIRIRKYFSFEFLLLCIWISKVVQDSFLNFQIFACTEFCPHPPSLQYCCCLVI